MTDAPAYSEWSTDSVDPSQRFDFYAHALRTALVPMRLAAPEPERFRSVMHRFEVGSATLLRQYGTARRCFRMPGDPPAERTYVIVSNLAGAWNVDHRGRSSLQPGDIMLVDTGEDFDLSMFAPYETVGVKLTEAGIAQWLPSPEPLVGRRISADDGWGRALSSFLSQLTPKVLTRPAVPGAMLVDHACALLSLAAGSVGASPGVESRAVRSLHSRVKEAVQERSCDSSLTAAAVAESLGISLRTLHRSLACGGDTFGDVLLGARAAAARRMLESRTMRSVSVAEIGRRAGFSDASHCARVLRRRFGASPRELRGDAMLRRS